MIKFQKVGFNLLEKQLVCISDFLLCFGIKTVPKTLIESDKHAEVDNGQLHQLRKLCCALFFLFYDAADSSLRRIFERGGQKI